MAHFRPQSVCCPQSGYMQCSDGDADRRWAARRSHLICYILDFWEIFILPLFWWFYLIDIDIISNLADAKFQWAKKKERHPNFSFYLFMSMFC